MAGEPIGGFLHYLMAECGVSPNTLAAYRSDLMRFRRWRGKHAPGASRGAGRPDPGRIRRVSPRVPPGGAEHRPAPGEPLDLLPLPDLRGEAHREHGQAAGGPGGLGPIADGPRPPIRDEAPGGAGPETRLGRRDRAALETLYASGCRASEVVGLTIADLDLVRGSARCVGKGDKQRVVPLGRPAREAISAYLEKDRPELVVRRPETREVFVSKSGRPLSRVSLWRIVSGYAKALGVLGGRADRPPHDPS